jgi:hypothetical protein
LVGRCWLCVEWWKLACHNDEPKEKVGGHWLETYVWLKSISFLYWTTISEYSVIIMCGYMPFQLITLSRLNLKKKSPPPFVLVMFFRRKSSITLQSSMLSQAIVIDLTSSQLPCPFRTHANLHDCPITCEQLLGWNFLDI